MKDTITIDGATYVALDAIDSPVKIVVIEAVGTLSVASKPTRTGA